jgi:hypothetical protein
MKETGAVNEPAGAGKGHRAKAEKSASATETGVSGQTGAATTEPGPGKNRKIKASEKSATATGTEMGVSGQTGATTTTETGAGKGHRAKATEKSATATGATGAQTNVSGEPTASATPGGQHQHGQHHAAASAAPSVAATGPTGQTGVSATGPTGQTGVGVTGATGTTGGAVTKADPQKVQQVKQKVQQIKQQHVNFKAQPRPDKVPSVTFNVNYRIEGSDRWQGPQYEVFRSYHPERHDRGWYSSRYQRIELICGGYYYWNNGYWYPAWGYEPSAEYYAYDAPIYVGHRAEPPDRVIADVQAELQEMGYYRGEVDGLLGPLTREALTAYQADQGLMVTAVIDEPTLESLGMG